MTEHTPPELSTTEYVCPCCGEVYAESRPGPEYEQEIRSRLCLECRGVKFKDSGETTPEEAARMCDEHVKRSDEWEQRYWDRR
jgi:hypothetical protein